MTRPRADGVKLGVSYYPEQWPRERWSLDAATMAEAGISIVRMAEFAWTAMEPALGDYDFAWLDDAVEIMGDAGIGVVLGTPTATPPAWLIERRPDILPVRADGTTQPFGNRRHYCVSSSVYHEATKTIVAAMGEHFAGDERVIGWQIDNELAGRCYCPRCREAFQEWLRKRYRTIEDLNARWGTAFWSQQYDKWEQIPVPISIERGSVLLPEGFMHASPSPSHALEYRRFISDSFVRYQRLQIEQLRRFTDRPITHNFMEFGFPEIDYFRLADDLDFVSWNNYPLIHHRSGPRWMEPAAGAAAARGFKNAPVWVMEQQVGPLGWETIRAPQRGEMRLNAYQAIAHGAEAVLFFRWRSARFGTEQHWYGVLDHDGRPNRRLRELSAFAVELSSLEDVLSGTVPIADVAIVYEYDSRFALEGQPTNPQLSHTGAIMRHFVGLKRNGVEVDLVEPRVDLSRYRVVVAPSLYVVDAKLARALHDYVEAGGTLVLGPRSGFKDRDNVVPERALPAWLDELAGVEVSEISSFLDGRGVRIQGIDGSPGGEFNGWFEELTPKGARPLAIYAEGDYAETAAITTNPVGDGRVVYIAGCPSESTLVDLYRWLAAELDLPVIELPREVEAVRLGSVDSRGELLFLLNFSEEEQTVNLGRELRDRLGGTVVDGTMTLPRFGVALLDSIGSPLLEQSQ